MPFVHFLHVILDFDDVLLGKLDWQQVTFATVALLDKLADGPSIPADCVVVKRQSIRTLIESACHTKAIQLMLIVVILLLGARIINKQVLPTLVRQLSAFIRLIIRARPLV